MSISIYELVVGDIIELRTGDKLPVDCLLLSGSQVQVDESNLTGEPKYINKTSMKDVNEDEDHKQVEEGKMKNKYDPFMLAGSKIMNGRGVGLVCCGGAHTQQGIAAQNLDIEDEDTPLQIKLNDIADTIGKCGLYCAILTFIACLANLIVT